MIITPLSTKPIIAATTIILNISDPTTFPIPISDSAKNVLMVLAKNSGIVVAVAINVAAATSFNLQKKNYCVNYHL